MSGQNGAIAVAVLAATLAGGCTDMYTQQDGAERGLIVVLPGVQGPDGLTSSIRRGLLDAGVDRAVVVQSWGKPVPFAGVVLNQVDFLGVRVDASVIADRIVAYQQAYPGRSVHIVGHSAGGALAVFVAESLASNPKAQPIDGLALLSASISSAYDLTKAMGMCKSGVLNCYNPQDIGLLGVGTAILGNLDGGHGSSAGLNGFETPDPETAPAARLDAYMRLTQHAVEADGSAHFASTNSDFVAEVPGGWILQSSPAAAIEQAAAPSSMPQSAGQATQPASGPQSVLHVSPDQWIPHNPNTP